MSSNRVTVGSALPAGNNNIGDVDVASVPAPLSTVGGGTEAAALRVTLASDSTGVVSVDDNGASLTVDGTVAVSNFPATQPVSGTVAISNPTANPETGLAKDVSLGGLTETAPASDTASSALNGRLQRIAQRLTSLIALLPASLGQKTKAASLAVTLASDQDALPITDNAGSLTVDGTVAATQSGTWNVTNVSGTVSLPTGASTAAKQDSQTTLLGGGLPSALATDRLKVDGSGVTQPVSGTVTANAGTNLNTSALALEATQTTQNTAIGGLTETAPATDTASSGLNGRLQRIAQRLTSLIAVFNIGAGTEAAAVRVTLPTDGTGKVNAAQSGTWTVQPGNTANTTAWKVDGSAVTQPVSNASLPLPTGASTAAKQPALGTAGAPSADVISVQGVASGTPQPVSLPTRTATPTATLTRPADTTAYADGDSVSSSTSAPTILTFANCVQVSGGTGMIVSASMRDSAYSATPGIFELWLLHTTTTPDNDNAAFTPTDAEVDTCVKVIRFSLVYPGDKTAGATGNMRYEASGLNWPFVAVGTSLFGIVVVRGAYTPISAETFKFDLNILQN